MLAGRGSRRRVPRRLVLVRRAARAVERPGRPAVDRRRRDLERHDARQGQRRLAPSGPARARHRPGEPLQWIAGDDGGVVRSNGKYVDASSECDSRGLNAADTAFCKSLLCADPGSDDVSEQGSRRPSSSRASRSIRSTRRTASGRHAGQRHVRVQGLGRGRGRRSSTATAASPAGTPRTASCGSTRSSGRTTTRTSATATTTKWVIISGKIASSPEGSNFYAPIIADPNPAMAGSIFEGSQSVWRTQDWGGDRDFLEANCPEFTTDGANPACGDFVRIGPAGCRPTSTVGRRTAPTAPARAVAAVERAAEQHRHDVGGDEHGPGVHHRQRKRRRSGAGRLDAARPVGDERPGPVRQLDLHRSGEREPRLDLVLGLQHQHAGAARPCVRGDADRCDRRRGSTARTTWPTCRSPTSFATT